MKGSAECGLSFFDAPEHRESVVQGIIDENLPLKYAYAGSAAYTHDRLAQEEGYRSVIGAVAHEVTAIGDAGVEKHLTQIVEIGPGNGSHTLELLTRLHSTGVELSSYLAVDFSPTLLTLFEHTVAGHIPNLSLDREVWDVEAQRSDRMEEWRRDGAVVVLFLGNTVGNLEDPVTALRNIRRSVRSGDTVIVGATLQEPAADTGKAIEPYVTEVFRAAALEPLVAAGIDADALEFRPVYEGGEVIGRAILQRPVMLDGHLLEAGKSIRCFKSRRFTADGIMELIREAGWLVGAASVDTAAEHIVVAATKG